MIDAPFIARLIAFEWKCVLLIEGSERRRGLTRTVNESGCSAMMLNALWRSFMSLSRSAHKHSVASSYECLSKDVSRTLQTRFCLPFVRYYSSVFSF